LKQQLQDAIKLKEELIEKQRLAQNLFIEPQLLQNAKKLDLQAKELLVQHNATATKLRVSLKSDKNLLINNKVVNQDLNQLISVTTTIEVAGIASIVITPGGTDLPDLANTLHQTKRDLQHVLAQAKVKTPEDLWQKLAQHISAMD